MKIAILTSSDQWFFSHAMDLSKSLGDVPVFTDHLEIQKDFDILFILSYHSIVNLEVLNRNQHNLVVHSSALPEGKGWSPLFWQIIEGKNNITFTLFEATDLVDDGDIYIQEVLNLTGYELNEELRLKQAQLTIKMCKEFLQQYNNLVPKKQTGKDSFYSKRTKEESKLDVDKTIKEQFNLLRTVNNKEYPAFFEIDGNMFTLKIEPKNKKES